MAEHANNQNKKGNGFVDVVGAYLAEIKTTGGGETFAELLESYDSRMNENIRVGDKISGKIISIGMDSVFIDTGTKIDGAVEKQELLDENGQMPYTVGDMIDLYVTSFTEHEIRLSKAISGIGGLNILKEAYQNGVPVEGKVKEPCKGGFYVEMLQRRAFCPVSQIDMKFVENLDDYVGKAYPFLITRIEDNGRNIVVSRRDLLMKEHEKVKEAFLEQVKTDMVLEGKVVSLMPYGVFVELFPGIQGMIHLSELSWARFEKPDELVKEGDIVKVKVIGIESGEKSKSLKIALSIKQLTGNPWESVELPFLQGDKVKGKVTRCASFGAFVEIAPGIEGMVHISEMSYKKRILRPEDVVNVGDIVEVMVKEIDRERKRISLSIKDAEGDPWIDITEKYKIGQLIQGKIEKKDKFGYFITLEPGITGLLPKSKISKFHTPSAIEKLKEGDAIAVMIEEIKLQDRRITLAPSDSKAENDWKTYTKSATASLGALGEKLQQAINSKSTK